MRKAAVYALMLVLGTLAQASAADVDEFFKGKTVNLVVGYGPGGGYDIYARVLARHLGAHIPGNPIVVVQNMPGAASMTAANYLFNVSPKDGTFLGTFDMNMPLIAFMGGNSNARFEPQKFTWLGSLSNSKDDAFVLWARKDAKVKTVADLRSKDGPALTVGVTAAGATDNDIGVFLRDVLGLKIRLVSGYPSSNAISLAVENGELDGQLIGYVSTKIVKPAWIAPDSTMHVLLQFARQTRLPELADVPMVRELATDKTTLQMIDTAEAPYKLARPVVAPPDVPSDRAQALQAAFRATSQDPEFLADAAKLQLEVSPVLADDAAKLIDNLAHTPPDVLQRLRDLHQ
jgi:tripartite-type tricarboxylate transporter receptor subunit TctC